jgi:hypothetical protein
MVEAITRYHYKVAKARAETVTNNRSLLSVSA